MTAKTIGSVITIEMETSAAYTEDASEFSVPEESEANYLDFGYHRDTSLYSQLQSRCSIETVLHEFTLRIFSFANVSSPTPLSFLSYNE